MGVGVWGGGGGNSQVLFWFDLFIYSFINLILHLFMEEDLREIV